MGFVSRAASVIVLFQEAREFVVIEPAPVGVQAIEEFEFADSENRHGSTGMSRSTTTSRSMAIRVVITSCAVRRFERRYKVHDECRSAGIALWRPGTAGSHPPV